MSKIDDLIKEMNKKAKEEIVTVGLSSYDYERIPFTSPRLNYCTYGGLPVGKLIEFFGEEHGGKTTTALDIVANYQNLENLKVEENPNYVKRKVLWVDAENTLDTVWAKKLGVELDDMIILGPKSQSAEEIFQFILDAIDTGEVGLWVLDSIGVLVSSQALEKTIEEKTYAGISQPLTNFSKQAEMLMHRHKCTGIGINQMRDDLNSAWGGQKTTGGNAWRHNCMVRIKFSKGKYFDDKMRDLTQSAENPCGNYVLMSMAKNKSCPPNRRTGFYTLNYTYGIDYINDLIEVAIKYGIVDKAGAWFQIIDIESGEMLTDKIQGQNNLYNLLEDDRELCGTLAQLVSDAMYGKE